MKRVIPFLSFSTLVFTAAIAAGSGLLAQAAPVKPSDGAKPAAEQKAAAGDKVIAIFVGNEKCPGSGKAIDRAKFVDTSAGDRVYLCCDNCAAGVKKDEKAAIAKVYPEAKPLAAKNCSCGAPIAAGKSTDVTWQGHKIALCCADCAAAFKKSPVTAYAMIAYPNTKDAKNGADPIDGKPVDATIVAIYKGQLIHFSSWTNETAFEKDPAAAMAKVKSSG